MYRFILYYLLIGMIIQFISISKLTKKLNMFGYLLYIINGCLWPINIAIGIYVYFFACEEFEKDLDDAFDLIDSKIFEEDP